MALQDVAGVSALCLEEHARRNNANAVDALHTSHRDPDSVPAEISSRPSKSEDIQSKAYTDQMASKIRETQENRHLGRSTMVPTIVPGQRNELSFSDEEAAASDRSRNGVSELDSDSDESSPKSNPGGSWKETKWPIKSRTAPKSLKDNRKRSVNLASLQKPTVLNQQVKSKINSKEDNQTGDTSEDDSDPDLCIKEQMQSMRLQLSQIQQRLAALGPTHSTENPAPFARAIMHCCSKVTGTSQNIGQTPVECTSDDAGHGHCPCADNAFNTCCQQHSTIPAPTAQPAPRFVGPYAPSFYSGPSQTGLIPSGSGKPVEQQITTGNVGHSPNGEDHRDGQVNSLQKKKEATYRRVDSIWDTSLFAYTLKDTARVEPDSKCSEYMFHVRRTFDHEGKHRRTYVDINSNLLRDCLRHVMGDNTRVSLVEETPELDPDLLFLYLDELRDYLKHLRQAAPGGETKLGRKRARKHLGDQKKQLKALIDYIDEDYAKVKASLYPLLRHGLITFDLLWALWKPNTLACTTTYGSSDEPRVFKVEQAERMSDMMKGKFYIVSGKSFEFDGKTFGYGSFAEQVAEFQGTRSITTLPCYPIHYHKDEAQLRSALIERGKKFVSLAGAHYMAYSGMAYAKRKKNEIAKFDIQHSRVMVDAAIFQRVNPNYHVSTVGPEDNAVAAEADYSSEELGTDGNGDGASGETPGNGGVDQLVGKVSVAAHGDRRTTDVTKTGLDYNKIPGQLEAIPATDMKIRVGDGPLTAQKGSLDAMKRAPQFTDTDYLLASPLVLGFSFSDKAWFEFTVSGIKDIEWNETAWDSLVLEPATKDLIKALVKSRKHNATRKIDDVIQGKGKGLVAVLHGPPGTGKTLTAEGISELLKCPLYMASAGELGTNATCLEAELQRMMDICHAWGAILLLDEADVFLEQRNMRDVQRNSLVSIFLRQLEYFQGTLFLTTNRVESFDEAFQSRIHIALRYDALNVKAKKAVFKMFIERVRALGKMELGPFTEADLTALAKNDLNGREIKNVISSAQDLAINNGEALGMSHVKRVMEVHAKFGRDLRGGTGYEDAMRSYF